MSAFLFQASADHYDLRTQPKPGTVIDWPAQRYRSLMRPGALVFFWLAGESSYRGLHGWGALTSHPYEQGAHYRVWVEFSHRIVPHVRALVVQADPVLCNHPIFTLRTGSNFLLDDEEVQAMVSLIPAEQRPAMSLS